jgi:hypothetical protein
VLSKELEARKLERKTRKLPACAKPSGMAYMPNVGATNQITHIHEERWIPTRRLEFKNYPWVLAISRSV